MAELLKGVKAGDFVEFDLITNPIEIDQVEHESEHGVILSFKCHSGYWGLAFNWDGTQRGDTTLAETGINDAFDIVKIIRT
ncbi:hypothetical protein [Acinetobacter radioresistens]|uniref:hypothetical protein n=1 Tax=Acinetobacter radioresistens TaxID=40216 RepID=UPI000C334F23|nr:hypothetical protein [Acinetobacter radioresistens]PKH31539.1 hypothetical protein BJF94_07185 [Acinetobacter radioresistens]